MIFPAQTVVETGRAATLCGVVHIDCTYNKLLDLQVAIMTEPAAKRCKVEPEPVGAAQLQPIHGSSQLRVSFTVPASVLQRAGQVFQTAKY